MAVNVNHVCIAGNVTRDPELRYTPGGTAVCDLGLAVNDRRKNAAGEWIDETTFVDATCWGRTAEIAAEYLAKGSPAFITGKLKLESWESNGQKRSKLKVVVDSLQLLGGKSSSGESNGGSRKSSARKVGSYQPCSAPDGSVSEDDIPF